MEGVVIIFGYLVFSYKNSSKNMFEMSYETLRVFISKFDNYKLLNGNNILVETVCNLWKRTSLIYVKTCVFNT